MWTRQAICQEALEAREIHLPVKRVVQAAAQAEQAAPGVVQGEPMFLEAVLAGKRQYIDWKFAKLLAC